MTKIARTMTLIGGLALALPTLVLSGSAFAQGQTNIDSDSDGVNDAMDAAPCDSRISARVFVPADRTHGMLLFEDRWPNKGDFDFNDVVVSYNQTLDYDSSANVTHLRLDLSIMAVGARFKNGLALRLPNTPRSSVTNLTFLVNNVATGVVGEVVLKTGESEAIVVLADDLHALFGVEGTREWVNTDPALAMKPYVDITVDIALDPGHNLSAANAPFDLFIFDKVRGTEVHRPQYRGTASLDSTLVGTADDGTTATRAFVTANGIPFALDIPELAEYPKEGLSIDSLYPGIVQFGQSLGTQSTTYYRSPSAGVGYGLLPPRALLAAAAADVSCFAPNPGVCGTAIGTGLVSAPTTNLCGFGATSGVTSSGGLFRWTCAGDYSTPTSCTTPDLVCQPNISQSCAISGGSANETCNGSGTGFGTCTLASCNSGNYQSGNACIAHVCSPGSSTSCSIANGNATQTCNSLGSALGACTLITCNSGFTRSGNVCQANNTSGTPGIPWPNAPQLYCNGGCSWDPISHCGQGDADIFCKLRTGSTTSRATSFTTSTALNAGGFSCPFIGTSLGSYPQFGGPRSHQGGYDVKVQATSILANHGPGTVINSVVCTP